MITFVTSITAPDIGDKNEQIGHQLFDFVLNQFRRQHRFTTKIWDDIFELYLTLPVKNDYTNIFRDSL